MNPALQIRTEGYTEFWISKVVWFELTPEGEHLDYACCICVSLSCVVYSFCYAGTAQHDGMPVTIVAQALPASA